MFTEADKDVIDMDIEIKKQAGIDKLNEYNFEYETETLCQAFNLSFDESLSIDDLICTRFLIAKKVSSNYERRYNEIKSKKK